MADSITYTTQQKLTDSLYQFLTPLGAVTGVIAASATSNRLPTQITGAYQSLVFVIGHAQITGTITASLQQSADGSTYTTVSGGVNAGDVDSVVLDVDVPVAELHVNPRVVLQPWVRLQIVANGDYEGGAVITAVLGGGNRSAR